MISKTRRLNILECRVDITNEDVGALTLEVIRLRQTLKAIKDYLGTEEVHQPERTILQKRQDPQQVTKR